MHVLALLSWAGVSVAAHVGWVVLPTGFGGARALFSVYQTGNMGEVFVVFHRDGFMSSSESMGTTILWWPDPSLFVMFLLSSPLACFFHDFWSNPSLQLGRGARGSVLRWVVL